MFGNPGWVMRHQAIVEYYYIHCEIPELELIYFHIESILINSNLSYKVRQYNTVMWTIQHKHSDNQSISM